MLDFDTALSPKMDSSTRQPLLTQPSRSRWHALVHGSQFVKGKRCSAGSFSAGWLRGMLGVAWELRHMSIPERTLKAGAGSVGLRCSPARGDGGPLRHDDRIIASVDGKHASDRLCLGCGSNANVFQRGLK